MKGKIEILRLCFMFFFCFVFRCRFNGEIFIFLYICFKRWMESQQVFFLCYTYFDFLLFNICEYHANILAMLIFIVFEGHYFITERELFIIYCFLPPKHAIEKKAFPLWYSLLFPPSSSHAFKSLHV